MNKVIFIRCTLSLIVFFSLTTPYVSSGGDEKRGIDFQILTDKTAYSPRSTMHVKFIVTNTSEEPLYLRRDVCVCSGQLGFGFFKFSTTIIEMFGLPDVRATSGRQGKKSNILLTQRRGFF
jgi:hypothetical protein